MPRANIPAGVIDMDQDDFRDGEVLKQFQELHLQIAPRTMAPQV